MKLEAVHHLEDSRDPHALEKFLQLASTAPSDGLLLQHLIDALSKFPGDPRAAESLLQVARGRESTPSSGSRPPAGCCPEGSPGDRGPGRVSTHRIPSPFDREKAIGGLRAATGRDLGYTSGADPAKDRQAAVRWRELWEKGKGRIKWRENLQKFE